MAACAFSILAISSSHEREARNRLLVQTARNAAFAGALIALGDLQTYTGTDDCATAKITENSADETTSEWIGAWHGRRIEKEFARFAPLVSNRGIFFGRDFCTMRNVAGAGKSVEVPWEKIGDNARVAFFIVDESQFASIAKQERDEHLERYEKSPETLQLLRQQIPRRTNFELFSEGENPDDKKFRQYVAGAPDEKIFLKKFLENSPRESQEIARNSLKLNSRSVPADWTRCELKTDLSAENAYDELIPKEALAFFREKGKSFPPTGTPVSTRPPKPVGKAGFFTHPFPIIAELKLHLGFFNPRTDGQHRARFHVTTRLWNPYAFPLIAHGDGRIGLFDAKNLPLIRIKNLNTGGEFSFSPTDFPVGRFGLVRQTPSDKTCNAYVRIFDASPQGIGSRGNDAGLLGGEVYLARFPDPRGQPEGLARNTGGASWKYQKNPAHIAKPPSGAEKDRWFHPAHRIKIESSPAFLPAAFLVRGDAGTLKQAIFPGDYSASVCEFRNVFLPSFSTEISGEEYNRAKAGDYTISQALLVWKIRLRAEDPAAMDALFSSVDPRRGIFDFSDPVVARAFEVVSLTGDSAKNEAVIGGNSDSTGKNSSPLRDRFPNEHKSEIANSFACIRIFDTPKFPVLSIGALRHCAFEAFPPHAIFGDSSGQKSQKFSPNAIFDRAYFSAKNSATGVTQNPHFVLEKSRGNDGRFLISGAFNINSENATAWAAMLPCNIPNWQQFAQMQTAASRPTSETKQLKNAFFIHPFSAQIPTAGTQRRIRTDKEFAKLSETERAVALTEQSLRELDPATTKRLAEAICRRLNARRISGKAPFRSLEEFADSGILKTALRESEVNFFAGTEIPNWFPTAISQRNLLEQLAPCATPRGDTFTIFCRAEIFHSITKKAEASACAEMRVQRTSEFFDAKQEAETSFAEQNALNKAVGRRYKILSFRWCAHDEF